jgi:hypothetical protein
MKRIIFFLSFLLAGILAQAQQNPAPYVVLVSFDGFRHDYVKNFNPPNFKAFIAKGVAGGITYSIFPQQDISESLHIGYWLKSRQSWIGRQFIL